MFNVATCYHASEFAVQILGVFWFFEISAVSKTRGLECFIYFWVFSNPPLPYREVTMLQGRWFNRGKATANPVVWASSELKTRGSGNDDTSQPYKVVVVVVVVAVVIVIVR